jgi:Methyltransferase domain
MQLDTCPATVPWVSQLEPDRSDVDAAGWAQDRLRQPGQRLIRLDVPTNALDASAQAVFHQEWQIYRTLIDHNYLYHREVYDCLHRILVDEAPDPFRFVDVACGDAGEIVGALRDTRIACYHGIDLSRAALDLAGDAVAALACPVTLEERDFVEALGEGARPADVVWIGLSLHHLLSPAKLAVMRAIRSIVGERGLLLIYEPASPDGEDRAGWLRRWDEQRAAWTAFTPDAWDTFVAHVHAADFPEPASGWHELGRHAGFATVREVFIAPSDLLRMYRFGPSP